LYRAQRSFAYKRAGSVEQSGDDISFLLVKTTNGKRKCRKKSLPATLRDSSVSLHTFKRQLKTYLLILQHDEHQPALLLRYLRVWRRYKRLFTYLLTY